MLRKKLLEYADWLERSRAPFNLGDPHQCISAYAMRFDRGLAPHRFVNSNAGYLMDIFDMPERTAIEVYSPREAFMNSIEWRTVPRKVAVAMLRSLARTGKVNWKRAYERVGVKPKVAG